MGGNQVGIEQPHQPGVNLKEAAPDRQISWVEPRRHDAGRFTGVSPGGSVTGFVVVPWPMLAAGTFSLRAIPSSLNRGREQTLRKRTTG